PEPSLRGSEPEFSPAGAPAAASISFRPAGSEARYPLQYLCRAPAAVSGLAGVVSAAAGADRRVSRARRMDLRFRAAVLSSTQRGAGAVGQPVDLGGYRRSRRRHRGAARLPVLALRLSW